MRSAPRRGPVGGSLAAIVLLALGACGDGGDATGGAVDDDGTPLRWDRVGPPTTDGAPPADVSLDCAAAGWDDGDCL